MEVSELRDVMDNNFKELDKRLAVCFQNIDNKNVITDKAIADIASQVRTHDHWLWLMRGVVLMFGVLLSWIGIKIRIA